MNGTPLDKFFNEEQIESLGLYNIKTVEQILSIRKTFSGVSGVAFVVGLTNDDLNDILDEAEKTVNASERTKTVYGFGAEVEKKYTLEQIKQAFWKTFHRSGEHWFPYKCEEEVSLEETQTSWECFEKNLNKD